MSFTTLGHVVGWVSMTAFLAVYLLLARKRISSNTIRYHLSQLLGALGLSYEAFVSQSWPIFVLELAWGVIAVVGIAEVRRKLTAILPSP